MSQKNTAPLDLLTHFKIFITLNGLYECLEGHVNAYSSLDCKATQPSSLYLTAFRFRRTREEPRCTFPVNLHPHAAEGIPCALTHLQWISFKYLLSLPFHISKHRASTKSFKKEFCRSMTHTLTSLLLCLFSVWFPASFHGP